MSDTQTLEGIKAAAPEGATHYHIGIQIYLFYCLHRKEWLYRNISKKCWLPFDRENDHVQSMMNEGVLVDLGTDDMVDSMPFELLEGDQETEGRKDDSHKPRFDLIPPYAQEAMARVLTIGAERYGEENWRHVDRLEQRYLAAAMRHLNALSRGEVTDPDTGEHHGAHVMCCAAFLVEHNAIQQESHK